MGPGARKLKHLPVKQQDKDTDDQRARMCRKRRGTGCADGTTSGETKRHRQAKLYKGELFVWFWIVRSSPYQIEATRKLIPTAKANSYGGKIDPPSKAPVRGLLRNSPPLCHELRSQAAATNSDY